MITSNLSFSVMIELWIDSEYAEDVTNSNIPASDIHHEPEHSCYRIIIRHVNEMYWLTQSWDAIAEHFGFQPESVVYCG
jgi:hypothetical protein